MQEIQTYLEENELGELVIKQEHLEKLNELKAQKESVEKELKALSGAITNELKTHFDKTTKINDYNFVVKGGYYSFEFDEEKFKEENPRLYTQYLIPKEIKQTCTLVSATRRKGE